MKTTTIAATLLAVLLAHAAGAQEVLATGAKKPMPAEWIDKDTGHRVVRLSGPTGPISNWYFHNNPFIAHRPGTNEGDRMVFDNEVGGVRQVFTIDLATRKTEQLTTDPAPKRLLPLIARATRRCCTRAATRSMRSRPTRAWCASCIPSAPTTGAASPP